MCGNLIGQIIGQGHYALFVTLAVDHQAVANQIVHHVVAGHAPYLTTA